VHDHFGGGSHGCGRPATGDDGLCGVHRNARRRRAEADARADQARRRSDDGLERARQLCDQLARYGVEAQPYWNDGTRRTDRGYDGSVRVSNPERLVDVLRAARLYDDAVPWMEKASAAGEPVVAE